MLAYLLTWVLLAPFFYLISSVLHEPFPWWVWVLVPVAFIGGSGPSVAALIITGRTQGREGLRRLLASLADAKSLGWRGYALPRLVDRFDVWRATLLLGLLWAFWHVPMMLFWPGASIPTFLEPSPFSVAVYLGQIVSGTALLTLLFLKTRGSVLLAVLGHLGLNTAESVLFNGLPELSEVQVRRIYLVNVAVLGCIGLGCLVLATRCANRRRGPTTA